MLTPDKQTASYNYDSAYTDVHQYDGKKPLTKSLKLTNQNVY